MNSDDDMGSDDMNSNDEGRGHSHGGSREMHTAVCSDCGQECQVPFAPSPGRPVYCSNCFKNHRKPRYGGGGHGGHGGGRGRY